MTAPEDVPPSWAQYVAAPRSPGAPVPYREYGAPVETTPATARRSGDQVVAVLAGVGAALVGAVVWGLAAYLTGFQASVLALVLGHVVGTVVHRVAGAATHATAVASALCAFGGSMLGFAIVGVALLARARDVGVGDALQVASSQIGWAPLLDHTMTPVSWASMVAGTWWAWMLVARCLRPQRRG